MKALIVVDLQYDFLPGGALAVNDGDQIIPIINRIQSDFDLIVATQDWHPENHKSFASQHLDKKLFEMIDLDGIPQVLWPDHCVEGTRGSEFSDKWISEKAVAIFRKGMNERVDSYSGFYDNNKKDSTGLLGFLNEKKVTEVYVCGLAADYCVYYTAVDAKEAGFDTYFLDFATKAISVEGLSKAKEVMLQKGINLVESENEL